jgi:DNA-binding NarL/FixJ family response regulator
LIAQPIFRAGKRVFQVQALLRRWFDRKILSMAAACEAGGTASEWALTLKEPSALPRTRLALVDDHGLFREGLGHLLASEPDFEVVGQCSTSTEALRLLEGTPVDLVLLELSIGSESGDEFMSAARQAGYQGRFLLVTAGIDPARAAAVLKLGASGIFLKCNSSNRLMQAIRLVASGEASIDQGVMQLIADRYPQHEERGLSNLTKREQTVLKGLLDGLTNKKIGRAIGVTESAIKATLQQLFDKAGVRTRSQLVRAALDGSLELAKVPPPADETVNEPQSAG